MSYIARFSYRKSSLALTIIILSECVLYEASWLLFFILASIIAYDSLNGSVSPSSLASASLEAKLLLFSDIDCSAFIDEDRRLIAYFSIN